MTIEQILEAIENMKVLELNELVKAAEEKFGVSASAPVMVAGAAAGGPAAEEKTEFDVVLTDVGSSKVGVIKAVREITGLGLKEAKEVVDNAPKTVKEGASKEEADQIKEGTRLSSRDFLLIGGFLGASLISAIRTSNFFLLLLLLCARLLNKP